MAGPDVGDPDDPLRILSKRLDRASEAAERLLADAAAQVAADAVGRVERGGAAGDPGGAGEAETGAAGAEPPKPPKPPKPPPAGWQQAAPAGENDGGRGRTLFGADADLVLDLLVTVRDRIPLDLQRQLTEAVRELLLALRALIDWYLERSERQGKQPVEVRDIPIL